MAGFNVSDQPLDFLRGCTVDFDLNTGLSRTVETGKRYLSQMKGMFADEEALRKKIEAEGDSLIYEFHGLPLPETPGDFAFGCSILNPGKIGNEWAFPYASRDRRGLLLLKGTWIYAAGKSRGRLVGAGNDRRSGCLCPAALCASQHQRQPR